MKVLVTGGAGFIGSHAVDALLDRGADVVCLDSLDAGVYRNVPKYLNPRADYCFADLRHWQPDSRFDDVSGVLHLAALGGVSRARQEPSNVIGGNVWGTARLLDIFRSWPRLSRVVLASSFSVYGSNYQYLCAACGRTRNGERDSSDLAAGRYDVYCDGCGGATDILPLDENTVPDPLEVYGASKYMQELCFRGFDTCPVHIVRQSSVYGPRLRLDDGEATIIAKIAGWVRRGEQPQLFEDGRQIRDWVYVGDSVAAMLALLEHGGPDVVNACTGQPLTLSEGVDMVASAMGSDVSPEVVGGFRPGDMRHCLGRPDMLVDLLGRKPVPFATGALMTFAPDTLPASTPV